MEGGDVVDEGGEASVENGLPREGGERFLHHGLAGDVAVLAHVVEDVVEIFLLFGRQRFALYEGYVFVACDGAVKSR